MSSTLNKKIRRKAEVYKPRLHFIAAVFQSLHRLIKVLRFDDVPCIDAALRVALMDIAMQTASSASAPRIPHRHGFTLPEIQYSSGSFRFFCILKFCRLGGRLLAKCGEVGALIAVMPAQAFFVFSALNSVHAGFSPGCPRRNRGCTYCTQTVCLFPFSAFSFLLICGSTRLPRRHRSSRRCL